MRKLYIADRNSSKIRFTRAGIEKVAKWLARVEISTANISTKAECRSGVATRLGLVLYK